MALLDFNRKTSFNVIPKDDFQELILSTFDTVAEVMARSLGPLGSTTTILDGQLTSATKDGWTIVNHLRSSNIYRAMVFNLIKSPCSKLNNTVGDGTTTAIVLTNLLFNAYKESKDQLTKFYRLPRQFTETWDQVVADIIRTIGGYARELPDTSVYNVAYVASNGNTEIASNIQTIYSNAIAPTIKLKPSPTNGCYIENISGYEFPAELTDDAYVQNEDMSATYENIRVLFFGIKVDSEIFEKIIVPLNNVYRAMSIKLLVLAPAYDELLAKTVLRQYANTEWRQNDHQFNLIVAQYSYNRLSKYQADDFAILLKNNIIDRYDTTTMIREITEADADLFDQISDMESSSDDIPLDYRRFIGVAPKAMLSVNNGSTFSGFDVDSNPRYKAALKQAYQQRDAILSKTAADRQNFSMEVGEANARIAQLQMETYIYYVGANSSLQFSVLNGAVDDVIKAVRSAVRYGVVPGCQLSIIRACLELQDIYHRGDSYGRYADPSVDVDSLKVRILLIIRSAVLALYETVLAGPDRTGVSPKEFSDIVSKSLDTFTTYDLESRRHSDSIITSIETDINVLTAASDLIKLLISGNQCIYLDSTLNNSEDITP